MRLWGHEAVGSGLAFCLPGLENAETGSVRQLSSPQSVPGNQEFSERKGC